MKEPTSKPGSSTKLAPLIQAGYEPLASDGEEDLRRSRLISDSGFIDHTISLQEESNSRLHSSPRIHILNPSVDIDPIEGHASIYAATMNCANTIVGVGTLSLPFAIASAGILAGNLICLALVCISIYSLRLLVKAGIAAEGRCSWTYEGLGLHTMDTLGFVLAQLAFMFGGTGLLMVYLIFLGQLLPPIITEKTSTDWERDVTVLVIVVLVFPICCFRSISRLQWVSTASVASVCYLACFIGITSLSKVINDGKIHPDVKLFEKPQSLAITFSMLTSAFSCHIATLPIYKELKDRSFERMKVVLNYGIFLALCVYECISIPPYLHFGSNVKENILETYEDSYGSSVFLKIANISTGVTLFCSIPIILWPFRSCTISLYSFLKDENVHAEPNTFIWLITTFGNLIFVTILAICCPSVKIAFSIVGCVGGALIVFILPALFYIKTRPLHEQRWDLNLGPICLAVVGFFACSISFLVLILKLD